MKTKKKFGGERSLAIFTMLLRIVGAALIGIGIYFMFEDIKEFISENQTLFKTEPGEAVLQMVKYLWTKPEIMLYAILIAAGIGVWAICYILAIIVISLASWKGQALGRALLIIATILFPVPVLPSFGLFFVAISPQRE
ncbi:hypothetical protein HGG64_00880 [Mycoplasma phocoeninasale]|uniref:Uncharacterized protein n=2 Tax=Mycoplasma phocoeninasale TaxID=2726117 RepID=A0A858U645_9MOLU|nr:hypothetical protein [Mycoplasma phocoeninasale]QJG66268.1 hypothetical protein HGG64_00880 [Mycoplasma phocoeninasale]